jgi:transposase
LLLLSRARNDNTVNMQESGLVVPSVLPVAERREAERSEAERSGATGKTGVVSGAAVAGPNPEVAADAKRRTFTAEYKQRILAAADAAAGTPGAVGILLRRERLYSSHLTHWRAERAAGAKQGLTPRKRGRRSQRNPQQEEMQRLQRENQRLAEQLRKAELIIEVQKKVAALLGRVLPEINPEMEP